MRESHLKIIFNFMKILVEKASTLKFFIFVVKIFKVLAF